MKTKTEKKPEQKFHYYASTAISWATAATRNEAIKMAARIAGIDSIRRNVKANGGLYCWSCRVLTPESATYTINFYQPEFLTQDDKSTNVRVPIDKPVTVMIQNMKGHVLLLESDE